MNRLTYSLTHLITVFVLCLPAAAQTKVLLIQGGDTLIDNSFIYGAGSFTRAQLAIPDSGTRGVHGLGPGASTLLADAAVVDRFITTAGFPGTAVDYANVSGLNIDGNKISTAAHPYVGQETNSGEWAQADVANGVELYARFGRVTDCRIRGFRGNGATITTPGNDPQWGFTQVDNCLIIQNFVGVYASSSDQRYINNVIANSRNAGIKIANAAGAVQTSGNHVYGAHRAYWNLGGDGCHSVNDYFADAYEGIHLAFGAQSNNFTNCLVQHCWQKAAYIADARNSFTGCRFWCAQSSEDWPNTVGVELDHTADFTSFVNCHFMPNSWQNPNDTGHVPGKAVIYFALDPAPDAGSLAMSGVTISGTAITSPGTAGDVLFVAETTSDRVDSLVVDLQVGGFSDANDKLFVSDADTTYRDCVLVFRGNFGGVFSAADRFDLPAAWNSAGPTNGNSITVYDTFNGVKYELDLTGTY
jgi:hypothetical protein